MTEDEHRDSRAALELDGKIEQTAQALELTQRFMGELDVSQNGNGEYIHEMTQQLEVRLATLKAQRRAKFGEHD